MSAGGNNGCKVVAFDLDGTLADTADLSSGRRQPALVLQHCRAHQVPTALEFSRQVSLLPSRVMRKGAIVAVVTRSPFPYAATLCYLLGIDYNVLLTSRDGSVEDRLSTLISGARIDAAELLYVGDRSADKAAADAVGATFMFPPWLDGDTSETGDIHTAATRTSLLNDIGQAATRRGRTLLAALQRAATWGTNLSENALDAFEDVDLDEELRSALAWMLLRASPAQTHRTELQDLAFTAVPPTAYDCVIPRRLEYGLACVSRAVMRRSEYEHDAAKRDLYFELLRRLHPSGESQRAARHTTTRTSPSTPSGASMTSAVANSYE